MYRVLSQLGLASAGSVSGHQMPPLEGVTSPCEVEAVTGGAWYTLTSSVVVEHSSLRYAYTMVESSR